MGGIGMIIVILLILAFVIFLIQEQIEIKKHKKNTQQVYISEWETKTIDKKDYQKYKNIDEKIREDHKKYNEWFHNLDDDRQAVYLTMRSGIYHKTGLRGKYIDDYIHGRIDKDEYERKYNEEIESDEYKRRIKNLDDYS